MHGTKWWSFSPSLSIERGDTFRDGEKISKEISNDQEEAQIEDGFPANIGSSGIKSSLGFHFKRLCVGRRFVYIVGV